MPEIKPCPFCGREPLPDVQTIHLGLYAVCCMRCLARGPHDETREGALKDWNSAPRKDE